MQPRPTGVSQAGLIFLFLFFIKKKKKIETTYSADLLCELNN